MEERDLYLKKFGIQLNAWKSDLAEFSEKVSEGVTFSRIKLNKKILKLYNQIRNAKDVLDAVSPENDVAWVLVKSGIKSSRDRFEADFNEVSSMFKNK